MNNIECSKLLDKLYFSLIVWTCWCTRQAPKFQAIRKVVTNLFLGRWGPSNRALIVFCLWCVWCKVIKIYKKLQKIAAVVPQDTSLIWTTLISNHLFPLNLNGTSRGRLLCVQGWLLVEKHLFFVCLFSCCFFLPLPWGKKCKRWVTRHQVIRFRLRLHLSLPATTHFTPWHQVWQQRWQPRCRFKWFQMTDLTGRFSFSSLAEAST